MLAELQKLDPQKELEESNPSMLEPDTFKPNIKNIDKRTLKDCEEYIDYFCCCIKGIQLSYTIHSEIKAKHEADDPSGDYASVDDEN